jgi:urease alpha subunit
MAEYDLVIRNTTIATAADVVNGDIGISAGRVVALGERLDKGKKEIDATGLIGKLAIAEVGCTRWRGCQVMSASGHMRG